MGKSNNNSKLKILFSVITIIMTILICIFIIYALKVGVFESPENLIQFSTKQPELAIGKRIKMCKKRPEGVPSGLPVFLRQSRTIRREIFRQVKG